MLLLLLLVVVVFVICDCRWLCAPLIVAWAAPSSSFCARFFFLRLGGAGWVGRMGRVGGGRPLTNPTVDGTHSSDLGQYAIANFYVNWLPSILLLP